MGPPRPVESKRPLRILSAKRVRRKACTQIIPAFLKTNNAAARFNRVKVIRDRLPLGGLDTRAHGPGAQIMRPSFHLDNVNYIHYFYAGFI